MEKAFPVSLDNLYEMMEHVREQAHQAGFGMRLIREIELAVEEAIVNIIRYSGLSRNNSIYLVCSKPLHAAGLQVVIKDKGIPFNPLLKAEEHKKIKVPLDQREPGGFGILLILKFMDLVEYKREMHMNILTLTKYNPDSPN